MEQIIFNFNVDVVIDTGDITDYGTSLENMVIEKISHLPVDYVFCAEIMIHQKLLNLWKI